jgi:hypothetical protein
MITRQIDRLYADEQLLEAASATEFSSKIWIIIDDSLKKFGPLFGDSIPAPGRLLEQLKHHASFFIAMMEPFERTSDFSPSLMGVRCPSVEVPSGRRHKECAHHPSHTGLAIGA